jgi:hypothetical protein
MNSRRAKLAAGATVLGLGTLGGAALGTNPGLPAAAPHSTGSAGAKVVTSASGAATAVARPVALQGSSGARAPIVTRASGAGQLQGKEVDD